MERRAAVDAASATRGYEKTTFGRRRVSRWPKLLTGAVSLLSIAVMYLYHRARFR